MVSQKIAGKLRELRARRGQKIGSESHVPARSASSLSVAGECAKIDDLFLERERLKSPDAALWDRRRGEIGR